MEIPRGRGVLQAKLLEEMYENKLEFRGGSMNIFWNCTMLLQAYRFLQDPTSL